MRAETRERLLDGAGALLSVLVHVAVILLVMDQTVGSARSTLFAARREVSEPMRVFRSADDLILEGRTESEEEGAERALSDPTLAEPDKLSPPEETAREWAEPAEVSAELASLVSEAAAMDATAGAAIDLSGDLLELTDPGISLPEFRAADDGPKYASAAEARAGEMTVVDAVSLRRLKRVLGGPGGAAVGAGGAGTGAGGRGEGGTSVTAEGAVSRMPPPLVARRDVGPGAIARPVISPDLLRGLPDLSGALAPEAAGATPVAEHLDSDFDYALFTLPRIPPRQGILEALGLGEKADENEKGYFEVRITPRRSLSRLRALYKDVVWVIDTSGSIDRFWSAGVRQGVASALDTLNEGDRFNIVTFSDTVSVLSPQGPVAASADNVRAARQYLERTERGGWTDVNQALGRLMVRSMPDDRVYQIVLVTDGKPTRGALDPRAIINQITRENDRVGSIYAVAIGRDADRELLEYLSYRNKGYVVYPADPAAASASLRELAGRLRYPILKSAAFSAIGVEGEDIYPRVPRDIYQGDTLSLYGRYDRAREKTVSMQLTGQSGAKRYDLTFHLDIAGATAAGAELARQWATWRMHHLYSQVIQQGESRALTEQIEELRKKYGLGRR